MTLFSLAMASIFLIDPSFEALFTIIFSMDLLFFRASIMGFLPSIIAKKFTTLLFFIVFIGLVQVWLYYTYAKGNYMVQPVPVSF